MAKDLFTIRTMLDGDEMWFSYKTMDDFLDDQGLIALFEDGLIEQCAVYCDNDRITGIPVMDWQRLRDHVIANSSTILRKGYP